VISLSKSDLACAAISVAVLISSRVMLDLEEYLLNLLRILVCTGCLALSKQYDSVLEKLGSIIYPIACDEDGKK
jgi:hypothetical protein